MDDRCDCERPEMHNDSSSPTWLTCYRCGRYSKGTSPDAGAMKDREDRMAELRSTPTGGAAPKDGG